MVYKYRRTIIKFHARKTWIWSCCSSSSLEAKNIAKSKWLIGCKKKHKDDLAPLKIFSDFDDCEIIEKIGNWEIELIPENNLYEETNAPDWYGYKRIDNY